MLRMLRFQVRSRCIAFRKVQETFLICKRTAIIPSRASGNRRRRKIKDVSLDDLSLEGLSATDSKTVQFKLKQLQEFTRNLREQMKNADSRNKIQQETSNGINSEDTKAIFDDLMSSQRAPLLLMANNDLSRIIAATEARTPKKLIPQALRERINDDNFVITSLIDKSNQNWNAIINKLHGLEHRLKDIPMTELKNWLVRRANRLSFDSIQKLDEMLLERLDGDSARYTTAMYECIFQNLASLKPKQHNDKVIEKMKELLNRYDNSRKLVSTSSAKAKMSQFILNSCIRYSSQALSFESMNYFLAKFKDDYGITPNRENYTTIIQFYTKMDLGKQAWDAFDTMKFLSKSHEPDVVTYNSVLHLCNKERDYARAIDLYQEMIDRKLEPTALTLNILAKTLARASADPVTSENKAESLRLLGWKYIHEIEDRFRSNHTETPFHHTSEAMMALAAYDGDVGLARALYYRYTSQKYKQLRTKSPGRMVENAWRYALDPIHFNYLLLAYSRFEKGSLPLLMGYEKGIKLRRNIMNSVDYSGRQDEEHGINARLPMLPIIDMTEPWQILSESRALWQFNLEYGGTFNLREQPEGLSEKTIEKMRLEAKSLDEFRFNIIQMVATWKANTVNYSSFNPVSLTSFLTIPIKMKDKKEFLLRVNTFCFQQHEFDSVAEQIYADGLAIGHNNELRGDETEKQVSSHRSRIESSLPYLASLRHKILANCATYELLLKAAIAFDDVELSTKAWTDRGKFRKTAAFTSLSSGERTKRDSEFAALMVNFFAKQGMLEDALGIIMTSKRYINWTYQMVKTLHAGLVEIEDEKSVKILLEIVNKKSPIAKIEEKMEELRF